MSYTLVDEYKVVLREKCECTDPYFCPEENQHEPPHICGRCRRLETMADNMRYEEVMFATYGRHWRLKVLIQKMQHEKLVASLPKVEDHELPF